MPSRTQSENEPIAIIGSACRFPGASTTPSKFWDLLRNPKDLSTRIPESRFTTEGVHNSDPLHHGTTNVQHSYLLDENVRLFDAQFFGIKAVEAISVDPQQRLLLETVYEGLENAGIPLESLQGTQTGVWVGLMCGDYAELLGRDIDTLPTYYGTGTARSIISNRISYFFDWHGPSMTIDTACSSSLIAVHQAVQSLRLGEVPTAVVAGSNLLLSPGMYVAESKLNMLSPTGRSRMWDNAADGYARGDGVGTLVLKTLSQALRDGDTIECLVRETGTNQDGRTKGITMPSSTAQTALIRETYRKAGLDLSKVSDRPQYFEAHGTGTPAGDPIEAEAISTAFFSTESGYQPESSSTPLYVGSAKTVIGHTEGTAGIAGVLKASLALQNGVIPPNLHFNELNPAVKPFYGNLQISNEPKEWPQIPLEGVRRASVNSFGFGGANAHAILEHYVNPDPERSSTEVKHLGPFNFSASSEKSLVSLLASYADYLKEHPSVSLRDLAFTLNVRRSTLSTRVSVAAGTPETLISKLDALVAEPKGFFKATGSGSSGSSGPTKLLGVFTGQGAQWASMGAHLIKTNGLAAQVLNRLQTSLDELPQEYRPQWTLKDELLKDKASSRIGEGAISQPLCAAVQILLVALLDVAKIRFHSVVGHSSGEIVAAYAAGYLSAEDAIRVAYLRGFFLHLAKGSSDSPKGGMLAAGTTYEDAEEIVELESFKDRVVIAASNSPESITLSGDLDAIQELKEVLDDEGKFARLLKVDTAYHSHHMIPSSQPYIDALNKIGIQILNPRPSAGYPIWTSSVIEEDIKFAKHHALLKAEYWSKNMVSPVLFSQAIEYAVGAHGPFHLAVEVGPHPALKSPAQSTVQAITGQSLFYTGILRRGFNNTEAFSEGLGYVWQSLGEKVVDFANLEKHGNGDKNPTNPTLLKDLPSYPWEHDREYWHESRFSKALRNNPQSPHVLLGSRVPDGTQNEARWRNYLNIREVPWLTHHQIQGQIIFPAAGYLSAVVEAVVQLYGLDTIQLLEFSDVSIGQALVLKEDASSVETLLSYSVVKEDQGSVEAVFRFHSETPTKSTTDLILNAEGRLFLQRGHGHNHALPTPFQPRGSFLSIESERFYEKTDELGFGYSGPFRKLAHVSRKMDEAVGKIQIPDKEDQGPVPLIVHPGTLDSAIQSIMLAFCYPGDGRLRSIYLPTGIKRLRINPAAYARLGGTPSDYLSFYSTAESDQPSNLQGGFEVYSGDKMVTLIQLDGLSTTPLTPVSADNDLDLFTEMTWAPESPSGHEPLQGNVEEDQDIALDMERVAYYYMRQIDAVVPRESRDKLEWHHQAFYRYFDHNLNWVAQGTHPFVKKEWDSDTHSNIESIFERYPESVDLRLMKAVGETLPGAIRNEVNILEAMFKDNLLNEFYARGFGMQRYLADAARVVGEISHRFPHQNIIELGAGTGSATSEILKELKGAFASYTYTDISSGFFEQAQEKFKHHQSRLVCKVLDIEKDIEEQSFLPQSYDLVVASLILHATKNLEKTMSNARRLLKPGGRLVMVEVTDNDPLRLGLIFAGLPGLWLGEEENRKLSPCVSAEEWEVVMKNTGFSSIEALTPHNRSYPLPLSVIVFRAVDDTSKHLYAPPGSTIPSLGLNHLTIIGGASERTEQLAKAIEDSVHTHYRTITTVKRLEDVSKQGLPLLGSILSLVDLEKTPLFKNVTSDKLSALHELFKQSKVVLWASQGSDSDAPYRNMYRGLERSIKIEMTHLQSQILDFDTAKDVTSGAISERLIKLEAQVALTEAGLSKGFVDYIEPELRVRDSTVLVPRIKRSTQRNLRYNAGRRRILEDVPTHQGRLTVQRRGLESIVSLEEAPDLNKAQPHLDASIVKLSYSFARPSQFGANTALYASVGETSETRKPVLVLSEELASTVSTPQHFVVPLKAKLSPQALIEAYTRLVAVKLLFNVSPGETVVVVEPGRALGNAIAQIANQRWLNVLLITSSPSEEVLPKPWQYLHPLSTTLAAKKALPAAVKVYVQVGEPTALSSILRGSLPSDALVVLEPWLESNSNLAVKVDPQDSVQLSNVLQATAAQPSPTHISFDSHTLPSITLSDLTSETAASGRQAVIAWPEETKTVSIPLAPAGDVTKFAKDKTYWLVGLTGGLGLSLCEWMAKKGAGNIVLSSRNPKLDPDWLQLMSDLGCNVRAFSNDITNREAVRSLYQIITQTLPPIAGVAQGAMILDDAMFPDLDLDKLHRVSRPKVEGSIWLDEIFSENTLDWFIFFSSITYVTGNAGQSAYAASNGFMTSLAEERRRRGLAGSAMNIGVIMGNGYVSRELTIEQQSYLHRVGHWWMSEQDFHQIFAECVLASRPESPDSPEFITGLRLDEDDQKNWVENPIFQHLVVKSVSSEIASAKGKGGVMIKAQLLEATSHEDVFEIIKDGLIHKLQVALQADRSKSLLDSSPDELGVDSLIAVDIRSWFLKEPGVDMPVLKILNSISVRELVIAAQGLLPASSVPNVSGAATSNVQVKEPVKGVTLTAKTTSRTEARTTPSIQPETNVSASTVEDSKKYQAEAYQDTIADSSSLGLGSGTSSPSQVGPYQASEQSDILDKDGSDFGSVELQRTVPMSFGQSRFWFLKHFVADQTAFNITTVIKLQGRINKSTLSDAVSTVVQRHESLRTAFFTDEETNEHRQAVLAKGVTQLEVHDIAGEKDVEDAVQRLKDHLYDLAGGESLRIQLLSADENSHWLLLGYHHINMDGVGYVVFLTDLEKAYRGVLNSGDEVLQYPDFTLRQFKEYESGSWDQQISFWKTQFSELPDPLPLLSLSKRTYRPQSSTLGSNEVAFRLPRETVERISKVCTRFRVTPFQFHLSIFNVLLFRYAGNHEDITIGVADANRKEVDQLNALGIYLNLLPLRLKRTAKQSFADVLRKVQLVAEEAFANSQVPFDVILGELNVPRQPSHTPLFQAFLNYRQNIQEAREVFGAQGEIDIISAGQNNYDISIDILENSKTVENFITISVAKDLYSQEAAENLKNSYLWLLDEFVSNPAARIGWPSLHPQGLVHSVIEAAQGAALDFQYPTLVHRIDDMAKKYATQAALKDSNGQALTYGEVQERVAAVGHELRGIGVSTGDRVGVFQTAGVYWIISLLAILRVGAVYVPFDPKLGTDRLVLIAEDCHPSAFLITLDTKHHDFAKQQGNTHLIDVTELSQKSSSDLLPIPVGPSDTAIIMYTSGSTGKPKGIALTHGNWNNWVEATPGTWGVREGQEVGLQQSSYTFDMSLLQIFTIIGRGGTLIIPNSDARHDPQELYRLVREERVTFTCCTPTEYQAWLHIANHEELQKSPWRLAVTGGEAITDHVIRAFRDIGKPDLQLFNCYGPTETTLGCADALVPYESLSELDTPGSLVFPLAVTPNYSVYIVDENDDAVPAGIPGEVFIGGAGVSNGYLNNDHLTAEKFISDNYASPHAVQRGWTRVHRSGDRGVLTKDGKLILLGRVEGDTQVKIGGIRIDLTDIEATINRQSPAVLQAVVSSRKSPDSDQVFLAAFVVLSNDLSSDQKALFLRDLPAALPLPQYMRPSVAVEIHSLPTSSAGKLDRRKLDAIPIASRTPASEPEKESKTVPDFTEIEETLRDLWLEVLPSELVALRRASINKQSDFFHIGGSSLSLINLQGLIREKIGVPVALSSLFEFTTLEQMAKHIAAQEPSNQQGRIDWQAETALDPEDLTLDNAVDPPSGTPSIVVLTGATGFIGRAVLHRLIEDPRIAKVYCLAVRKKAASQQKELFRHNKVVLFPGDLGSPRLGLTRSQAESVFISAEAVIHAGADVSFMKTYQSLKLLNVASVRELVRLSAPHRLPLHFVSSAGVARLSGLDSFGPQSIAPYPPSPSNPEGYIAAKYVSEVFLEKAAQQLGFPVWIHRPSSVVGDDPNNLDLMSNILNYAKKIRAVAVSENWQGYFDFISVEKTAMSIVDQVVENNNNNQAGSTTHDAASVKYIYQAGETVVPMSELRDFLEKSTGESFEPIPLDEWVVLAEKAGLSPLLAVYLRQASSAQVVLPRLHN